MVPPLYCRVSTLDVGLIGRWGGGGGAAAVAGHAEEQDTMAPELEEKP